jgi:hypothetical protein
MKMPLSSNAGKVMSVQSTRLDVLSTYNDPSQYTDMLTIPVNCCGDANAAIAVFASVQGTFPGTVPGGSVILRLEFDGTVKEYAMAGSANQNPGQVAFGTIITGAAAGTKNLKLQIKRNPVSAAFRINPNTDTEPSHAILHAVQTVPQG